MTNIFPVDENMLEIPFQNEIIKLAKHHEWELIYHTHDSRKSAAGFPDLVMIKNDYLLVRELKSIRGVVTPDQTKWLAGFDGVKTLSADVWRPGKDNAEIIEYLTTRGK